ncbi:undecaprenyl-phosphate mannosyltransferase [Geobacter sp. OR-1]|uniref:glycosyltransferase family 2 protein n=1 Tax=Geobacter sp. OR-1 TaxID=1266765 RepID=UPI0005429D0B|nr:glycosyltransferase family 2 protein [Geobacter sp. OR-1]GAM10562.1 undecaprenyl-phosphate mannosyltransferase [Geobacter sp. OR-1]
MAPAMKGHDGVMRQPFEPTGFAAVYGTPVCQPLPTDGSDLDITLFVPCYNEEENIVATLEEIAAAMAELDLSSEVIVIDDASTDNSVSLVLQYMSQHGESPLRLLVREQNEGVAQNFIEAAFLGRGRYYKLVNGDNVENRDQLVTLLLHIGEADMLLPYHAHTLNRTLLRRVLSRLFTLTVNVVSGYKVRYYNGCGVNFRYNVMRWNTNYHGFGFQADLITRLLDQGKTFVEIPVVAGERSAGASKALTMKNFFSVAHFFLDIGIRRVGRIWRKRQN